MAGGVYGLCLPTEAGGAAGAAELQVFRKTLCAAASARRPRMGQAAAASGPPPSRLLMLLSLLPVVRRWRGPALGALLVLRPADAAAGGHVAPHGAGLLQRLGGGVFRSRCTLASPSP